LTRATRRRVGGFVFAATLAACNGQFVFDEQRAGHTDAGDAAVVVEAGPPPATCTSDADCPLASLHCDTSTSDCVACVSDSTCAAPYPKCDSTLQRCVACEAASDCASNEVCDGPTHRCVGACQEDADDCPSAAVACDRDYGECLACTHTSECADAGADKWCDPDNGLCVVCAEMSDCAAPTPVCDRTRGVCAGCLAASDCSGATPVCDPAIWTCVAGK
jgi:hypothetical protein